MKRPILAKVVWTRAWAGVGQTGRIYLQSIRGSRASARLALGEMFHRTDPVAGMRIARENGWRLMRLKIETSKPEEI